MNWSPVGSFVEPIILFHSMSYRMANSKGLQVRAWCLHADATDGFTLGVESQTAAALFRCGYTGVGYGD